MAVLKISDLTLFGSPPDNDTLFYGLYDGTDDYAFTGGDMRRDEYTLSTATGGIQLNPQHYVELSSAVAIALTISGAPHVGDTLEIYRVGTGGVNHTVILSGAVTWDGSQKTLNFADDADYIRVKAISATRWRILQNTGVTISA